jgi:hypothetical protein
VADGQEALFVVFDGPPGPEAGRFVDVETADGANPAGGSGLDWQHRADGYWTLGPISARIREVEIDLPAAEGRDYQWPQPARPIRVLVATEPLPHGQWVRSLPYRLVSDADYVLSLGGVLKDRDGLFVDRPNVDGGDALRELALQGPVEYVRWPA